MKSDRQSKRPRFSNLAAGFLAAVSASAVFCPAPANADSLINTIYPYLVSGRLNFYYQANNNFIQEFAQPFSLSASADITDVLLGLGNTSGSFTIGIEGVNSVNEGPNNNYLYQSGSITDNGTSFVDVNSVTWNLEAGSYYLVLSPNGTFTSGTWDDGVNEFGGSWIHADAITNSVTWRNGEDSLAFAFNGTFDASSPPITQAIPEPSSWLLLAFGIGAIAAASRGRHRQPDVSMAESD